MGVVQPLGERGSLKWIQRLVNGRPDLADSQLLELIGQGDRVEWLSPVQADEFREYRDSAALDLLGVSTLRQPLPEFWPGRGPQWDALARVGASPVLIEAKAHVRELFSGECRAESERSREMIRRALDETKEWLDARPGLDWMHRFYQYANRLAHLYFLRTVNGLDAHLVFLYFVGDEDMGGPTHRREWEVAIEVMHEAMGIRGRLPPGVHGVFLDVEELQAVTL